jgi:hypothetical protein
VDVGSLVRSFLHIEEASLRVLGFSLERVFLDCPSISFAIATQVIYRRADFTFDANVRKFNFDSKGRFATYDKDIEK